MASIRTPDGRKLTIPEGATAEEINAALAVAAQTARPGTPPPAPPAAATGGPPGPPAGGVAAPIAGGGPGGPGRPRTRAEQIALEDKLTGTSINPTEGMSGWRRFGAGAGQSVDSTIRGTRQLFNYLTGDEEELAELKQQENERRQMDEPLLSTGAGRGGQVAGHVLQALLPGVGVARGVKVLGGGAKSLIAAEAALGGGLGALQPVTGDESRSTNAAVGAMFGAALPAGAAGVKALRNLPASVMANALRMVAPKGTGTAIDLLSRATKTGSSKVREAAGRQLGDLTRDVRVPVTKDLASRLRSVRSNYQDSLPPDVIRQVDKMIELGSVPGAKLKGFAVNEARTAINREAASSKGLAKTGMQSITRALDDALLSSMSKSKAKALRAAREQYKTGVKPPMVSAPGAGVSTTRGLVQGLRTGSAPYYEQER